MEQYREHMAYTGTQDGIALAQPREYEAKSAEETVAAKPVYSFVKRLFDIVLSLIGLVVLSPLFLAVAVLIRREDRGPVFYRSTRVGRHGETIGVFKFRSMRQNADHLADMLTPEELVEYRKEFKLAHDPRITRIGSFLRKTSLDELPQLLNILRGGMSVVGPRPLVQAELMDKYSAGQRRQLLSVRPGLTGLWQVNGRSDCTYESGERQKLELDYVERRSILMDLKILIQTVGVVLKKVGAR